MATALKDTLTGTMEKPKPALKAPGSNTKGTTASGTITLNPLAMFNIGTITPGRDVNAEQAGTEIGAQSANPTNPAESGTESTANTFGIKIPLETGGEIPAMPSYVGVPAPVSADQIVKAFQPYFSAIEGQTAPAGRTPPPPTPALATFLSVLAGSLGAQLTKNPAVQESIMNQLASNEQRRQAIQDQNYAEDLVFNQQKAQQRLAATGQMLETELASAIKANDTDRAMAIQKNMAVLEGWIKERLERVRGQEDLRVQVGQEIAKAAAQAQEEAKPLDPKDYTARRNQIVTSKLPETGGLLGGIGEFFTGKKLNKIEEIARIDKEALQSGNPNTTEIAKRNIKQEVLRRVGLSMKNKFNKEETKKIADELRKTWDVGLFEVFPAPPRSGASGAF